MEPGESEHGKTVWDKVDGNSQENVGLSNKV
jgi:hypothetical protein